MRRDTELTRRGLLAASAASAATAALPSAALANATRDASADFEALLRRSADADAVIDPANARDRRPGPVFVDPLDDRYAARLLGQARQERRALAHIRRGALPADHRIAYDVLEYRAVQRGDAFASGAFQTARLAHMDPSFGPHIEFLDMFASTPFRSAEAYHDGRECLDRFAGYLGHAHDRSREGLAAGIVQPAQVAAAVLQQIDSVVATPADRSPLLRPIEAFPDDMPAHEREEVARSYRAIVEQRIYPAYAAWATFLRETYLPRAAGAVGRSAMKRGVTLYACELARHTTTTLSPDHIHALGLSEVARIRDEMETTRAAIGATSLPQLFEQIRTDPRYYYTRPQDLLDRFRRIEAMISTSIPRLFRERPTTAFEVRALPTLGEMRGTGYYKPASPGSGEPGVLYFNMAMLSTRPIPTLETLNLHEGIPGHHFQIMLARENAGLPPLLRFGSWTAYDEGWGLYAETLGPALGMFTDPLQRFGHLDMAMLRACRLVVDTGLHAGGWPRSQAIDFLRANTSMAERDIGVEIDRYIAAPGQACAYKIGELKIQELRDRASRQSGAGFDVREFHHQVLATGALPMDVLGRKIDEWTKGKEHA